jgi:hypothetical protein
MCSPKRAEEAREVASSRTSRFLLLATCIAHDVNPRAYLHLVTKLIVHGWPQSKLRDLLPDRIVVQHPELLIGERDDLAAVPSAPLLPAPA